MRHFLPRAALCAPLLTLVLAACATPPLRYDAFADAMVAYAQGTTQAVQRAHAQHIPPMVVQRVHALQMPPMAVQRLLPEQTLRHARLVGRGRSAGQPALAPEPDCASPSDLTADGLAHCSLAMRLRLVGLTQRHADTLAAYFAVTRVLATQFNPVAAVAAVGDARTNALAAGEALREALMLSADQLQPMRAVWAPVGLRPPLASEMASYGWNMRIQMEIQSVALERLDAVPAGQPDAVVARLRASLGHLRAAYEVLLRGDGAALPEILLARQALRG